MAFTEVSTDIVRQFEVIVGPMNTIVDPAKRFDYSHDETEDHSFLPDVVLNPGSAEEISQIMKLCNAAPYSCYTAWRWYRIKWWSITRRKRSCDFHGTLQ